MYKLKAAITKELQLLLHDKVGLLFMFFMPIVFVFIITIIQNSAYELVNKNKISLIIANQDNGSLGDSLIQAVHNSNMFTIHEKDVQTPEKLNRHLLKTEKLAGLFIPSDFSSHIKTKSSHTTSLMLEQLGISSDSLVPVEKASNISLIYDPVLQQGYIKSVESILLQSVSILENSAFIEEVFSQVGIEKSSAAIKQQIFKNKTQIETRQASRKKQTASTKPNATQHNIPAWTLFAMFFMVVSLANNIVKEKNNGSFIRLRTMPAAIHQILVGKIVVYIFAAFLQVLIIFSIGFYIFPLLGLPKLNMNFNILLFAVVVLISSLAAVSWSMLIGTFSKTQEQASGVGSISIIIFAAIGGVWVPTFVMPEYMKVISKISPMNWSLDSFYALILKNGSMNELIVNFIVLLTFVAILQIICVLKLKKDNLI